MNFIRTTIVGGLVFLVPVVVLVLVVGEALSVLLLLAEPVASLFRVDSIGGIALANLIAAVILVLVCFIAGLVARTARARKLTAGAETAVLQKIPGYTFLKGLTSTMSPHENADLKTALVSFGSFERVGLEVERLSDGRVVVYLPSSPNAWSGLVKIVSSDQVTPVDLPMMSAMEHAERLGRGTGDMLAAGSRAK